MHVWMCMRHTHDTRCLSAWICMNGIPRHKASGQKVVVKVHSCDMIFV